MKKRVYIEILPEEKMNPIKFLFIFFIFLPNLAFAKEYNLTIDNHRISVNGRVQNGLAINGQVPAPTLHFTEGEDVVIHVQNNSDETTSLHWHGLLVPAEMDGVPGLNYFGGIKPNENFTYRFHIRQSGTYWYHSHSGGQEARGLYGALIIDPQTPETNPPTRDYTLLLSDFTDENIGTIINNLKANPGHYNAQRRTLGDFAADAHAAGLGSAIKDRLAWGQMRMDPTDLSDVSGYDFVINGIDNAQHQTFIAKKGERVRLRLINGSAMTYFDFRIPGLKMRVIAADGRAIEPVEVDELRMAVAEIYDVEVTPDEDKAYIIVAEAMDRTGQALATLAPTEGMTAETPPMRPRAILTMQDMGMGNMAGMDMSQMDHANMTPEQMAQMNEAMPSMNHGATLGDNGGTDGRGRTYGWGSEFPSDARVLSYADLASAQPQADLRQADREIIVRLGGNMERYIWTTNGQTGDNIPPINLRYGEKVKITFVNETMMAHPMHLHGMFVQLDNGQDVSREPDKHIVSIAPGQTYSVYLVANEVGEWSFHCHLLNHMASGMMTTVVVAKYDGENTSQIDEHQNMAHMNHGSPAAMSHKFSLEFDRGLDEAPVNSWDGQFWYGSDENKIWLKSEGVVDESSEAQILYSHKISDFFDLQIGVGSEFNPDAGFAVLGIQGLAPFQIETEAYLKIGDGFSSLNYKGTMELYLSQKLYLEPSLELKINLQDNISRFESTGFAGGQLGINAIYKTTPNFMPYLGYSHETTFGATRDILKSTNQETQNDRFSLGLKLWF